MSPQRALATAVVMAFIPSFIFFIGVDKYSTYLCDQIGANSLLPEGKEDPFAVNCINVVNEEKLNLLYSVILISILIEWPLIRLLDDLQWYREWVNKGKNK